MNRQFNSQLLSSKPTSTPASSSASYSTLQSLNPSLMNRTGANNAFGHRLSNGKPSLGGPTWGYSVQPSSIRQPPPVNNSSDTLDMSEFPALGSAQALGRHSKSSSIADDRSMTEELRKEEFPALPGAGGHSRNNPSNSLSYATSLANGNSVSSPQSQPLNGTIGTPLANRTNPAPTEGEKSWATKLSGSLQNTQTTTIPNQSSNNNDESVAITNKYGMLGMLSLIKPSDQQVALLVNGCDLTTLGLNLNSQE
ncbi:hypothetical protein K7432_013433 [Basidiobolus ranarum]|uniref:Uncharacterized protein n=1 Tax=Basidiobolus ranarum TaxID=34480 RepID=A0ABR2VRR1_9FUNG